MTYFEFDPNDFVIRLSPEVDEYNNWTGDISVGMLTTDDNVLNKEDYLHLKVLTDMLIAAIPLMEHDASIRHKLFKYIERLDEHYEEEEEKPKVTERDGNVLKVNF